MDGVRHDFEIYWPPRDPDERVANATPPLLRGDIAIQETSAANEGGALQITFTITRPSTEEDRRFWNSQLAFADVPWMDEVRVWDADSKWQWPNLPFLLRRHGRERVDRYGGVDPGKKVDNDFAAVLIRKFNADGTVESHDTLDLPLVSAEWHAAGQQDTDIHTVVHVAKSDPFVVHVGGKTHPNRGKLKVWLIYADFLRSRPPISWPSEREWAGGILAFCEIDWEKLPNEPCRGIARFKRPTESTGFDWEEWSDDFDTPAKSRLNDSTE